MGTSARKLLVGSAVKMFKFFVTASCFAAALGAEIPRDGKQLIAAGAPLGLLRHAPNCKIEQEVIAVQSCTPRAEQVCDTIDVEHQNIEYEKICKEVTSTHCPVSPAHIIKREAEADADAEADPQFGLGLNYPFAGYYPGYYPGRAVAAVAPAVAAPVPVAPTVATVKHACHEVTTEHCVDSPKAVTTVVPLEHCHVKQVVDCVPAEQTVPKTVCDPVETKHVSLHPFAYHY